MIEKILRTCKIETHSLRGTFPCLSFCATFEGTFGNHMLETGDIIRNDEWTGGFSMLGLQVLPITCIDNIPDRHHQHSLRRFRRLRRAGEDRGAPAEQGLAGLRRSYVTVS